MKKLALILLLIVCVWGAYHYTRQGGGSDADAISNGERVTITDYYESEKTNIFLFYADW